MIRLYFDAVDGPIGRFQYKSLEAAQRAAQRRLGEAPEIGSLYAVSGDGVVTLRAEGASWGELFPKIAASLAFEREEAQRLADERREIDEYMANYQECEHGLDANLCGGPMHWYDEDNGGGW